MFYKYWIVRYVPNVVRGEFVNIGLLVGSDDAEWAFREVASLRRANRLGGDPSIARYWLRELERMVAASATVQEHDEHSSGLWVPSDSGEEQLSEGTMLRLSGRLNNAVQLSQAHTVVADSAQGGLEMLFDHLVSDPVPSHRTQFRTRITRTIEESFIRQLRGNQSASVQRRPLVHVGRSSRTADIALADNQVEQITKAWSFNLADPEKTQTEIEAWAYFMNSIQDRGGVLTAAGGAQLTVPSGVQFRVIYEEPTTPQREENLSAAAEIWSQVEGLKTYSAGQAQELVRDGLALVA
ncbi:DUF3037 domain-containing protein [Arthrobacter sp. efr-133-TYG-120]|uniref:DUF3037 domain-containing protein n=1 Tax=Arthrobacter sp. efr-133-TYG-120 TaxID=3040280 RepID=UPI00254D54D0|nr:DUF3037 domain-containing protein [Arthrobacter sp. efr-133-TYG-120]